MRAIDADALIGELHTQFFYDGRDRTRVYAKIQDQPTIEPERKTVNQLPSAQPYSEADIQKMQDLEQAEIQKAYELGKLDAEPRWIPVSERLPEAECGESDNVLTTCAYKDAVKGYRRVETLYYNGGVWCYPTGETFEGRVKAWMPLPEPYREEGTE